MPISLRSFSWLVVLAALGTGCSSNPSQPQASSAKVPFNDPLAGPSSAPADASREAEKIFAMRCTPCHGPEGRGDGPASAALTPHPRNFHDAEWQKQASDEHIAQIIQYGGAAVGKSPAMPANPDLTDKPAIVAALRTHIRALAR
jgi:mono/diheme cytochrome c family protein